MTIPKSYSDVVNNKTRTVNFLEKIYNKLKTIISSSIPVGTFSGENTLAATVVDSSTTTEQTIAAGAVSVAFTYGTTFVGVINGVSVTETSPPIVFTSEVGKTLPAIKYTRVSGTIYIQKMLP